MNTRTVLTSQHTDNHWTADDVREKLGRELESDPGLAEFLAAAPDMARALSKPSSTWTLANWPSDWYELR